MQIPYERNPLFTGRERLLEELDRFFSSAQPVLKIVELAGLPGVGKTEVGLEYVYRSFHNYRVILWLDAQSRHQLAENISSALGMGLSWSTDAEREQIFATFRRKLWGYQPSFLLVLDQIGDHSLLNDLLDEDMGGHVLMTHAERATTDMWKSVTVQPFDEQESSLFLLRRIGLLAAGESLSHASLALRNRASEIHTEFGGHPLALDQAGAYLKETGKDLASYLPLYRQGPRAFLDRRGTSSLCHPFSAYGVIAAMRAGRAYFSEELLFLYVQNLLDCSDPYPSLATLRVSSQLRELTSDPSTLFRMRSALIQNFLLVPLDATHGRWGMHPLVRTVMHEIMAYEKERDRQNRAKDDEYEPLDEEGIVHLLLGVQQVKRRQATVQWDDHEAMELARAITTPVLRLQRGVLPVPRKQREQAKARIEHSYSDLAFGKESPLNAASGDDLRRYACELLDLMQCR